MHNGIGNHLFESHHLCASKRSFKKIISTALFMGEIVIAIDYAPILMDKLDFFGAYQIALLVGSIALFRICILHFFCDERLY